jgi:hypothetical protein
VAGDPAVTPSAPAEEPAGSIKSFTEGVLTITLKDGSMVSGKVTDATEITCPAGSASKDEGDEGDDVGAPETDSMRASVADTAAGDPGEVEQGDDEGEAGMCTSASLVAGAVVQAAELRVGGSGAIWTRIALG